MIRRDRRRRQATDVKPLRRAVLGSADTKTSWLAANVLDDERWEHQAELRIEAATAGDLCDGLGTRQGGNDD